MPLRPLSQLAAAFSRAASLDDVRRELADCAAALGCPEYTYVFTDIGLRQDRSIDEIETAAEFLTNLDAAWTRRYLERQYFAVDPVVRACYHSRMPIVWSAADATPMSDPDALEMLVDAHEYGLTRGISVPIHGFSGSFGIFSLYSAAEEEAFRGWAKDASFDVQRFAFWFHDFFAARYSQHKPTSADEVRIRIKPTPAHQLH